ncbi:Hypothetical protein CINCED_3A012734 [Cinara cedri]|uniref:Major facilitator superfamily (MFS) profile domain-containing protein n=1 Tax=Cinara cedri TaxID=506608 RepID=A0A5E4NHQ8_9HEMI|nr:Hypothetical protein CINCED_3A012734 [Cinara cedri]
MSTEQQSHNDFSSRKYIPSPVIALLATMVQSLLLVNVGMELSICTIVIGSLYKNPNAEFHLSVTNSSWYGSILYLCQPFGSCLSGYLQVTYGKKFCSVVACVPSIIGWIILSYSNSVPMLYLSTLTMGIGLGFTDGPAYSYIGEISEPRLRGIMACVINMACLIGMLATYGLGSIFHWRTVAMLSTLCPLMCLIFIAFIPESPIWLLSKNKNEKAMDAICWLRGWVDPCVVSTEYQELMFYYKTSVEQKKVVNNNTGLFSSFSWLKSSSVYRPLRLTTMYYIITLISCLTTCRPYIMEMMKESGVKDSQSIALVLFGSMQLAGSLMLTFTIQKLGKRLLTIMTLSINIISIFLFALYIMGIRRGIIMPKACIPIIIYSVIMFSGAMGVLTVPWTLVSEVYPNEAKGFASSLTTSIFYILTFLGTKVFLNVQNALGLYNTFFMFGALSFAGLIYLYNYLPETANKTLLEIEEFFVPEREKQTTIESKPSKHRYGDL